MIVKNNIILERKHKKPIVIDIMHKQKHTHNCTVIFCHGYKGFKDWGAWNLMGKHIANAGYCFVKFNFSHNGGTVNNPIDFPDLEAFGNNNYTKELDDLSDIINWSENYFKNKTLCLIGHSRGGGIAIIKAAEDPRIAKLITLAAVCDFEKRTLTGNINQWKKEGVKYVLNGRTKQQMPHYYQFYEDFMVNQVRLNIKTATKKINVPFLIIHGDKDTSVPIDEAKNLKSWQPKATLSFINDADHVFNIRHPYSLNKPTKVFSAVIDLIVDFLNKKSGKNPD